MAKRINQYKTTYYKEQGALIGIVMCLVIFVLTRLNQEEVVIERPPLTVHKDVIEYVIKPVVAPATAVPSIEDKIHQYFPRSYKTMIAVAKAESHMSMDAKGYNCFYNKDETIVYTTRVAGSHSRACKEGHRKYAWSVDCFVLQKNYKGQQCPKGMTLDKHLQEVADLSRVQGLSAWTSYNDGKHLKYLADSN